MTPTNTCVFSRHLKFLIAAGLLAIAPAAFAQPAPQLLAVAFVTLVPAAPLSDWVTVGIALLLAATAIFMLRRQTSRARRLFGWMLTFVAGTTLFVATGQRVVSDAEAGAGVGGPSAAINLIVSPGTLDVSPFVPASPLTVTVTNATGRVAQITAVTLNAGLYLLSTPTTCTVGLNLAPSATCVITLDLNT